MDVKIGQALAKIDVQDATALLTPPVMARIVAEVKRAIEADERLKTQRASDRSADTRRAR